MNKKIFILMMLVVLISLVNAQEPDFFVEEAREYQLKVSCENAGAICSSTTDCNITISYENSTIMIDNANLTNLQNGFFSITLGTNETTPTGIFSGRANCVDGERNATTTFNYKVTTTGTDISIAEAILYVLAILLMSVVLFFTIMGSINIPFRNPKSDDGRVIDLNKLKYLKVFFIVISYLLLMFIFGTARSITANFLDYDNASAFFNFAYWFMLSFLYPTIVVSLIVTVVVFLTDRKWRKAMQRRLPLR